MDKEYLQTARVEEIELFLGGYINRGRQTSQFSQIDLSQVLNEFVDEVTPDCISAIRSRLLTDEFTGTHCGAVMPDDFKAFKKLIIDKFSDNGKFLST